MTSFLIVLVDNLIGFSKNKLALEANLFFMGRKNSIIILNYNYIFSNIYMSIYRH